MRPPCPDHLPQMKGRLDRPGQDSDELFIEFFYISNTIEEGLLSRMDIANHFSTRYIMPLALFYDMAVQDFDKD